jgi:hypothetical protein
MDRQRRDNIRQSRGQRIPTSSSIGSSWGVCGISVSIFRTANRCTMTRRERAVSRGSDERHRRKLCATSWPGISWRGHVRPR